MRRVNYFLILISILFSSQMLMAAGSREETQLEEVEWAPDNIAAINSDNAIILQDFQISLPGDWSYTAKEERDPEEILFRFNNGENISAALAQLRVNNTVDLEYLSSYFQHNIFKNGIIDNSFTMNIDNNKSSLLFARTIKNEIVYCLTEAENSVSEDSKTFYFIEIIGLKENLFMQRDLIVGILKSFQLDNNSDIPELKAADSDLIKDYRKQEITRTFISRLPSVISVDGNTDDWKYVSSGVSDKENDNLAIDGVGKLSGSDIIGVSVLCDESGGSFLVEFTEELNQSFTNKGSGEGNYYKLIYDGGSNHYESPVYYDTETEKWTILLPGETEGNSRCIAVNGNILEVKIPKKYLPNPKFKYAVHVMNNLLGSIDNTPWSDM